MTTRHLGLFLCASLLACDLSPKDGGEILEEGTGTSGDNGSDDNASTDGNDASEAADGETTGDMGTPITDLELCQAVCVWETGCSPGYPMAQCVDDCLYNLAALDGDVECDAAMHTLAQCVTDFTMCEPDTVPAACTAAANLSAMCEEKYSCSLSGGGPVGGGEVACNISEACGLDPMVRSIECDAQACTCTVDGGVTGQCPSAGVCEGLEQVPASLLAATALECCGFEHFGEPPVPGE